MKQWVKDGIAEVAWQLAREKKEINSAGFPLEVYLAIRIKRPDIADHLNRYGKMDAYQYVKMYVPRDIYT